MICLSFDTDHCDEGRMRELFERIEIPGRGTFFCTQRYECIPPKHEQAPHAELESLDWAAPLDQAQAMFPDAKGFRSHACLSSHGLSVELARRGYTYISAHDQFGQSGIEPRRETWGLWHLPIYYMDTLDISFSRHWGDRIEHEPFRRELLERAVGDDALYVFAMHPVHLLLNVTSVDAYLERRDAFRAGAPLDEIRCEGFGAGEFYAALCELMEGSGVESVSLADAVSDRG